MKRSRQIEWQGIETEDDFHVVPVRKRRRNVGERQVIQRRSLLGHVTSGKCWCKPDSMIRRNGSLLWTHRDLPS